ncbi:MAG: ABC transporter permease [Candidatus Hodarchaeota archaeon]
MDLPVFLAVTKSFGKQFTRNRFALILLVFLPGFMIFAFFFGFSSVRTAGASTYNLAVINNDMGLVEDVQSVLQQLIASGYDLGTLSNDTVENGFATDFISTMGSVNYTGENGIKIFNIYPNIDNEEEARKLVESREVDALVIFPDTFSNATLAAINDAFYIQNGTYDLDDIIRLNHPFPNTIPDFPTADNATVRSIGDKGYLNYRITEMILELFINEYKKAVSSLNYPVEIVIDLSEISVRNYTVFDVIVPGMFVFGVLAQAGILSSYLTSEIQTPNKTMTRIRLSLIKSWEYVTGASCLQLLVTPIQIIVLMGMAIILGFQPEGSILQGFFILWLSTLFPLAITFIAASIFSSAELVGQLIGFGVTPLAFASGAFIDVPKVTLIPQIFPTASGSVRDLVLWDLLPSTHAINALRSVLLYNFSIIDVIADLAALVILSSILFVIGIFLYSKRRFKGDI